jgi:hypothetical protein
VAITTAITNSAKQEFLQGIHLAADVYKIALIKAGAVGTFDKNTTNYSALGTDEASGTGYTAGGLTLTGYAVALTGDTASIDWSDAVWTAASISADGAIIYNSSKANRVLQTIAFVDTGPVPVTSTNANFTVTIPSAGVGQIRWT